MLCCLWVINHLKRRTCSWKVEKKKKIIAIALSDSFSSESEIEEDEDVPIVHSIRKNTQECDFKTLKFSKQKINKHQCMYVHQKDATLHSAWLLKMKT